MKPPFKQALLPALISFIVMYWAHPRTIEARIDFKGTPK